MTAYKSITILYLHNSTNDRWIMIYYDCIKFKCLGYVFCLFFINFSFYLYDERWFYVLFTNVLAWPLAMFRFPMLRIIKMVYCFCEINFGLFVLSTKWKIYRFEWNELSNRMKRWMKTQMHFLHEIKRRKITNVMCEINWWLQKETSQWLNYQCL